MAKVRVDRPRWHLLPTGFGVPGLDLSADLLVSISGSTCGAGQLGAVDAINGSEVKASEPLYLGLAQQEPEKRFLAARVKELTG